MLNYQELLHRYLLQKRGSEPKLNNGEITELTFFATWLSKNAAQQSVQRTATPHEHLQAEFDYICVGCGNLVKRRR